MSILLVCLSLLVVGYEAAYGRNQGAYAKADRLKPGDMLKQELEFDSDSRETVTRTKTIVVDS